MNFPRTIASLLTKPIGAKLQPQHAEKARSSLIHYEFLMLIEHGELYESIFYASKVAVDIQVICLHCRYNAHRGGKLQKTMVVLISLGYKKPLASILQHQIVTSIHGYPPQYGIAPNSIGQHMGDHGAYCRLTVGSCYRHRCPVPGD